MLVNCFVFEKLMLHQTMRLNPFVKYIYIHVYYVSVTVSDLLKTVSRESSDAICSAYRRLMYPSPPSSLKRVRYSICYSTTAKSTCDVIGLIYA